VTLTVTLPTLVGHRCTLRPLRPSDAPSLQRHADDPAVAYNLFDGFPHPYTLELAQAWCGRQHLEPAFAHVLGVVVERDEVAGCISVTPQNGMWACSAVTGYWLGQAYWGRGVMSEALSLVTDWAWAALPQVTRLWMPIYARNVGSQGVARRAGYTLEGHLPRAIVKTGRVIDAVQYGCTRPGLQGDEPLLPTLAP
jgi:[ribosomal protein S5]-alanine N-acetyltransferase